MSKISENEEVNMDDILGAALDDLDDEENDDDSSATGGNVSQMDQASNNNGNNIQTEEELNNASEDDIRQLNSIMQEIFKKADSEDDSLGAAMQALQQHVSEELKSIEKEGKEEKKKAVGGGDEKAPKEKKLETKKKRPVFGPEPPPKESDVDRTINKLLNDMASASKKAPVPDFEEMMKGFDNLDNEGGDAIIDGLMQQLLTKDLMYEPMKQVTEKFPKWLEEKKETLSKKEYEERCNQLEGLQALIRVYDTEPENTDKLIDLMKDVQEYGLPPTEIVADIAPDLELDEEGAPKINHMQDCSIM